jgi:hypothetical protein
MRPSNLISGDPLSGYQRNCAICKKEIYCREDWVYKMEIDGKMRHFCGYTHFRQAQAEQERKEQERQERLAARRKILQESRPERPKRLYPWKLTEEQEREIWRRFLAGEKGYIAAQAMGIQDSTVYRRYREYKKGKRPEFDGKRDHEEEHPD